MADDAAERRLRHEILIIAHRVRTDSFYTPHMIWNDLAYLAQPQEPPPLYVATFPLIGCLIAGTIFQYFVPSVHVVSIWIICGGLGLILTIGFLIVLLAMRWEYVKEKRNCESLLSSGTNAKPRMFVWSAIRDRARSRRLRN